RPGGAVDDPTDRDTRGFVVPASLRPVTAGGHARRHQRCAAVDADLAGGHGAAAQEHQCARVIPAGGAADDVAAVAAPEEIHALERADGQAPAAMRPKVHAADLGAPGPVVSDSE